jgi:hypothetical protein
MMGYVDLSFYPYTGSHRQHDIAEIPFLPVFGPNILPVLTPGMQPVPFPPGKISSASGSGQAKKVWIINFYKFGFQINPSTNPNRYKTS